jgi:hypothetical protein
MFQKLNSKHFTWMMDFELREMSMITFMSFPEFESILQK